MFKKKLGTIAMMLKAFLLARFLSVLLLKEQMIISVKKIKTLVRSLQTDQFFAKFAIFYRLFYGKVHPKYSSKNPAKLAYFSATYQKL